ncbi:MAG: hypothetical protein U9O98_05605 [Asgard group archaeon]|nr:hypothetical protein [Asgard group archaeon]
MSVVFGIVGFFCLFLAAFGIYYGPNVLTWVTYVTVGVVAITLSIVGLLNDWVTHDLMGGFKTTDNIYGKLATQIIPAIFVIVSNILLILTYRSTKLPNAKKRIGYFTLGYSTIILGLLFFVIDTFLSVSPYIFPILALCTWVLGPFLVLFGFYTKPDTTPQNIFYQTLPEETVINIDVK